ncbi:HAD family hydrolase [Kitasatospora sp. RB6PN24]|uniref:HAD family hydrolase n=1 Tax=Kitasatospora humi TaxID=2893891 RepID=UPI001E2CE4CA|nr:HAD family hydrolase [Kitasatospora humi]MCC9305767.1 HAD family hydrolase [Kitasatospora humi]
MTAAALFDVDGTLLDTTYLHALAWSDALEQYGHRLPMARIHGAVGMGGDQLLEHLLPADRDRDDDARISAAHQALYARFWPRLRPFDGAAELLRRCASLGQRVVLASSASGRDLSVMRRVLDADPAIWAATSADDVAASKPAPDLVQAALAKAEVPCTQAVFIGDTKWDVEAAVRAEVPCIAVRTGGAAPCALRSAGAVEVHEDVAALLAGLADSMLGRIS